MTGLNGIVVGVDGSDESRDALKFALDQARERSTTVHIVTAYYPPRYWALPVGMPIAINEEEIARRVQEQTQDLVNELLAGDPAPPKTDVTTVSSSPAKALLAASRDAELLVVGHRGRGAFASMTLGSVALHCVLHARCPVTVVRPAVARAPEQTMAGAGASSR
jgi:nucleotide-binding universal stress UspA family protein